MDTGSSSNGASFTIPPILDGALDDTDNFLNDRSELVVRRINSQNQSYPLNRTKTDNSSFKNSDSLNSKAFNYKVGTSISNGFTLNRTLVNSFHVSPRTSRDAFPTGTIIGTNATHDYTEIMGYKNIEISRDVDQSYMLKGTSTNHHSSLNKTDASQLLRIENQSSNSSNNQLSNNNILQDLGQTFLAQDTSTHQNTTQFSANISKSKQSVKSTAGYYAGATKFKTGRTNSLSQIGVSSPSG
jgi:hypothetical protein